MKEFKNITVISSNKYLYTLILNRIRVWLVTEIAMISLYRVCNLAGSRSISIY